MSDHGSLPLADSGTSEQSTPTVATPGTHNLDRSVCAFDSFEYRADGNAFHATCASPATDPCVAVVSALAVVTDTDPTTVDPLHETVDTDALDALLARNPVDGCDISVAFTVDGHDVTVTSGGALTVRPPEPTDS